jgi:tetratricopeptide (TPR) repeat protein
MRYHHLGTIAEKQSRFKEAEAAYEKELEIELARGDRRRAADTYHQLGKVAQEQSQFTKAEASYTRALEIFIEVDDRQSAEVVLRSLACLFAATDAPNIPSTIAAVLKIDVGEANALMEALRRESSSDP